MVLEEAHEVAGCAGQGLRIPDRGRLDAMTDVLYPPHGAVPILLLDMAVGIDRDTDAGSHKSEDTDAFVHLLRDVRNDIGRVENGIDCGAIRIPYRSAPKYEPLIRKLPEGHLVLAGAVVIQAHERSERIPARCDLLHIRKRDWAEHEADVEDAAGKSL